MAFEHIATGLGSFSLVVPTAALKGCREELARDIRRAVAPDGLTIIDGLAMIAVVGRGMIDRPGIAGKLFSAVGEIGVNVRVIDMGSSEMNIVIGVKEESYEESMRAIFARFFSGQ